MNCKVFFVFLSLLIALASCKQSVVDMDRENDIAFDTITVNEQYYLLGDSANPYCTLESVFIYPSGYKDGEVLRKIRRHFLSSFFGEEASSASPEIAMENYVKKYISDYRELENDFLSEIEISGSKTMIPEALFSYYEISSNEILFNKCDLLSYCISVEYFTGGAHGDQGYNSYVIHLKTGNRLEEKDIFVDNYQDDLAQIIVDAIAVDNSVTDPSELENMGFFNIREIYPNNNFHVDADGITYTFNNYEIAARFVGKTDVTLPYDKIRHLMRENSPVSILAFTER